MPKPKPMPDAMESSMVLQVALGYFRRISLCGVTSLQVSRNKNEQIKQTSVMRHKSPEFSGLLCPGTGGRIEEPAAAGRIQEELKINA